LNNIVTLKSGLEVTQRHLNWYRSKDWVLFLFAFHSNYGRIFNRLMVYSTSKYSVTFKTGLGVVQGHWKWRRSIDYIRLTIGSP